MMNADVFYPLIDKERNIYELAELHHQQRKPVEEYISNLIVPNSQEKLLIEGNKIISETKTKIFRVKDNIIDFRTNNDVDGNWDKLNTQFMNYHKSLTLYTLINSTPLINYLSLHSGIGNISNAKVVDVGGGTGHTLCSFFQNPETIDYYLVDPNLRLLHDQFIRIYPKLTYLQMAHILAYAEHLPFCNEFADVVLSLAAIDHLQDFKQFISESKRILKTGGILFISSHLDIPEEPQDKTTISNKLFSASFWERVSRYLYYRKHSVASDDHTLHLKNTEPIEDELKKQGFTIEKVHGFKRNFYIIAKK